jgi:M6 family metalloprotease-like protein
MRSAPRRLPPLTAVLLLALALPAARGADAADLDEFRTVETAVKARVSRSFTPERPRQPAYLGVHLADGRPVLAHVEPGSPADRAGLRPGDVLRRAGGKEVTGPAALRELLQAHAPGDALQLAVARDDKPVELSVTLGATSRPLTNGPRPIIGVQIDAQDDGARIAAVTPGSPAAEARLKEGDLIVKVDGTAVAGPDGLGAAMSSHKPGDTVTLVVRRDRKDVEVKVTLAAERTRGGRGRGGRGGMNWDDRQMAYFKRPAYRLAVVPVEYPDVKHNDKVSAEDWDKALFSRNAYTGKGPTGQPVYGSLNDYYQEQSCGAFRVAGKVFDYVAVAKKRAAYNEGNRFALLTEALDKLLEREGDDALADFDGLFFLYAGDRVQTQRGGLYWPHRASVSYKGKRWGYFICPEGGRNMASISVIAHEFGHLLGLPDLYAQPNSPGAEGLGVWCTMSTGHGRDGKPLHFSAWCKQQLGWLEPAVIDPTVKQKLMLRPVEGSRKECFKVLIRPDGGEYLLLENRVRKNFDRDLPGEGLLIWRVVNNRPVLEESHGITTPDGPMRFLGSVPYPSASNNAFTPYTTPSSKSARGGLPVHITNIRRLPDGRVTFFIGYEYL